MEPSEDDARYRDDTALSTADLQGVARSAGVVGGATLASRVLGLVRDVVLANTFRVAATDTFFIAFMIPNLFRRLVGEGTLTAAFVPVFSGWLQRSREEARRLFNATWTLAAALGLLITVGGVLWADPIIHLFAPGFAVDPEKHALCVTLLRLCFPYILFLMLVAVAMGALNAMGHFLLPALAPVLLNLCLIAAALGAMPWLDPPILGLGLAVLLAGLLQLALQIPALRARGMKPRPLVAWSHPGLRRLGVLMGPALLGASVLQLNVLLSRFLASFEGDGAVSYLYYAGRLIEFPLGVFVLAVGTASLPTFSRLAMGGDRAELRRAFSGALGMVLALALPSTVGLVLLREPVFVTLFAWDPEVFGEVAVSGCSRALLFFALGLLPAAVSRIYVNVCMAHENPGIPAWAAVVSLAVNVCASLALVGPLPTGPLPERFIELQHAWGVADLGFVGLALAVSLSSWVQAVVLVVATHRRYGSLVPRGEWVHWARLAAGGAVLAAVLLAQGSILPLPDQSSGIAVALLALQVGVGAAVYLAALRVLRSREIGVLLAIFRPGHVGQRPS